uniref:mTERF domain-containing protein, mitochondrial n=1 Tax=Compsopogon caeruleus TaxID=31354 RepID=A0A7S1TEJ5_9RHOD|mmetsp:Transcript_2367/g.4084  ORF Transcript_2367/g.4084 Transcript_2367/m.4084 type:complete len:553 (+) Transcript_2367:115-1773(+)
MSSARRVEDAWSPGLGWVVGGSRSVGVVENTEMGRWRGIHGGRGVGRRGWLRTGGHLRWELPRQLRNRKIARLNGNPEQLTPKVVTGNGSTQPSGTAVEVAADIVDELNEMKRVLRDTLGKFNGDKVFRAVLQTNRMSSEWSNVMFLLSKRCKMRRTTLTGLLRRNPEILALSAEHNVSPVISFLKDQVGLKGNALSHVIGRNPKLLELEVIDESAPARQLIIKLSDEYGISREELAYMTMKWSSLLCISPEQIDRIFSCLSDDVVGLTMRNFKSLIRRCPAVMGFDIDKQMRPVIQFLSRVGFRPVRAAIQIHPQLFGCNVQSQLYRVYEYILSLGIEEDEFGVVFARYPMVLTASIEETIDPIAQYMKRIGLTHREVRKIVRSFPNVLLVNMEDDVLPKEEFFVGKGMASMRRLISRLPAVLTFDLRTDIVPKYNYLERILGLSTFELLRFPAYLQYSLEERIWPRTSFVRFRGLRIQDIGLNNILAPTDEEFCARTVRVPAQDYQNFLALLPPVKGSQPSGIDLPPKRRPGSKVVKSPSLSSPHDVEES